MIVKVILGKVGEYAYIKIHSVYPCLVERVRRYFHNNKLDPFVLHIPQYLLQVNACRRGTLGFKYPVANKVMYGAYQAYLYSGFLGYALYHIGGAGLAVGSGNAHHLHLP